MNRTIEGNKEDRTIIADTMGHLRPGRSRNQIIGRSLKVKQPKSKLRKSLMARKIQWHHADSPT